MKAKGVLWYEGMETFQEEMKYYQRKSGYTERENAIRYRAGGGDRPPGQHKKEKEMIAVNNVVLMGRLAQDPELRYTTSGVAVASFVLAVNRPYKNKDGSYTADFIPCVAWRATAEFVANNFEKGNRLAVTGRLETRSYEDQSGNRRKVYEVIAEKIDPIDWKSNALKEDIVEDDEEVEPFTISDDDLPWN